MVMSRRTSYIYIKNEPQSRHGKMRTPPRLSAISIFMDKRLPRMRKPYAIWQTRLTYVVGFWANRICRKLCPGKMLCKAICNWLSILLVATIPSSTCLMN